MPGPAPRRPGQEQPPGYRPAPGAPLHGPAGHGLSGHGAPGRDGAAAPGGSAGPGETPPPADVYGPDDPGYGPPDPSWYERRKRELEREREEEEFLAEAAGQAPSARGAFEPRSRLPGSGEPEPTSLDLLLESGDGTDRERDPLDRVRDLYLAAEAVSETDLDRRFTELLDRQRTLIGAYFDRSRPPMPDTGRAAVPDLRR